jgi:hypothetical protein
MILTREYVKAHLPIDIRLGKGAVAMQREKDNIFILQSVATYKIHGKKRKACASLVIDVLDNENDLHELFNARLKVAAQVVYGEEINLIKKALECKQEEFNQAA